MKKNLTVKILSIALSACMLLCAAPLSGFVGLNLPSFGFSLFANAATETGTCGENLTWSLNTDTGVLTISGTGDMTDYDWSDSPWYYSTTVKSVIINNGVTSIGEDAFHGCTGLTSITIPDGVTSIGDSAFQNCTSLTSITIPDGETSIGDFAFKGCTSLTSITIPDGVTSVDYYAFYDCTGLTEMNVSENNLTYCSVDGVLFNKDKTELIFYPVGKAYTSYTIPDGVKSIGKYAFRGCTSLTSITIPDGVKSICDRAFSGCTGLTSIIIPNSVTSIEYATFYGCTGLTSITIPDGVKSIVDCVFSGCTSLTSIIIPDGVTSIEYATFYGCTSLTSITIPDSVTSFKSLAFEGCTGLTSITIPDSVTGIGYAAFSGCTSLTSITIPDSVTNIGAWAFEDCTGLTSITIPNSVTSIGTSAFWCCTGLNDIYIYSKNVNLSNSDIGFSEDESTGEKACNVPTVIHGYPGSTAEAYAQENNLTFVYIKDNFEVKTNAQIKLSSNAAYVLTVNGTNANTLLNNTGKGVSIITLDGKIVSSTEALASGMKLILKDGKNIIDSKTIIVPGDVDGDAAVSAADARLALRNAVNLEKLSTWQTTATDTDADKKITSADARKILRAAVGLEKVETWLAEKEF